MEKRQLQQRRTEERQQGKLENKKLMETAERAHKSNLDAVRRENKLLMKQAKVEHNLLCQEIEVVVRALHILQARQLIPETGTFFPKAWSL